MHSFVCRMQVVRRFHEQLKACQCIMSYGNWHIVKKYSMEALWLFSKLELPMEYCIAPLLSLRKEYKIRIHKNWTPSQRAKALIAKWLQVVFQQTIHRNTEHEGPVTFRVKFQETSITSYSVIAFQQVQRHWQADVYVPSWTWRMRAVQPLRQKPWLWTEIIISIEPL